MGKDAVRIADTAAGVVVAMLGLASVVLARRLPYSAEYGPGAGFLPLWLGIVLLLLSLVLIRSGLRGSTPASPPIEGDPAVAIEPLIPLDRRTWQRWGVFFGSTVGLALVFEPLGVWLSTFAYTLVTVRWVAHRAWPATLLFAILTPIGLYVGFVRLLQVPLPLGPFAS